MNRTLTSQNSGLVAPKNIVSQAAPVGAGSVGVATSLQINNYGAVETLLNTVANTPIDVLSVTGAGRLKIAAVSGATTTLKQIRLKVTLDGVVVFDSTTIPFTSQYSLIAVGNLQYLSGTSGALTSGFPVDFKNALVIQVINSVTENSSVRLYHAYDLVQQ